MPPLILSRSRSRAGTRKGRCDWRDPQRAKGGQGQRRFGRAANRGVQANVGGGSCPGAFFVLLLFWIWLCVCARALCLVPCALCGALSESRLRGHGPSRPPLLNVPCACPEPVLASESPSPARSPLCVCVWLHIRAQEKEDELLSAMDGRPVATRDVNELRNRIEPGGVEAALEIPEAKIVTAINRIWPVRLPACACLPA